MVIGEDGALSLAAANPAGKPEQGYVTIPFHHLVERNASVEMVRRMYTLYHATPIPAVSKYVDIFDICVLKILYQIH